MDDFEQQLEANRQKLLWKAIVWTRHMDDAEDVVQKTLLRAIKKKALFKHGKDLGGWLHVMLKRVFIDHQRAENRRKRKVVFTDEVPDKQADGSEAGGHEISGKLMEIIRELPTHQADTIMLRLRGMQYKEIADHLGVPIGTVMSRMNRAKSYIMERREELQGGEEEK